MKRKTELYDLVKEILEKHECARDNDFILYGYVLNKNGISARKTSFHEITKMMIDKVIPSFCSIERARRKVQEYHEELAPSKRAKEAKDALEEEYRHNDGLM